MLGPPVLDSAMSHILGIGRLCIDHYLTHYRAVNRFDGGTKASATELAQAVGGSVPRILGAAAAVGSHRMQFYSGAHPSDIDWLKTELVRLGIDADIQATSSTARSFIEFERNGRLARVVSIETDWELSHSLFADQPSVFSGVTDIVIDARYPSACLSLAKNVRESSTASATIWLDPGSTAFNSEERTRAIVSILPLVDVLVATTDFLSRVST